MSYPHSVIELLAKWVSISKTSIITCKSFLVHVMNTKFIHFMKKKLLFYLHNIMFNVSFTGHRKNNKCTISLQSLSDKINLVLLLLLRIITILQVLELIFLTNYYFILYHTYFIWVIIIIIIRLYTVKKKSQEDEMAFLTPLWVPLENIIVLISRIIY